MSKNNINLVAFYKDLNWKEKAKMLGLDGSQVENAINTRYEITSKSEFKKYIESCGKLCVAVLTEDEINQIRKGTFENKSRLSAFNLKGITKAISFQDNGYYNSNWPDFDYYRLPENKKYLLSTKKERETSSN